MPKNQNAAKNRCQSIWNAKSHSSFSISLSNTVVLNRDATVHQWCHWTVSHVQPDIIHL